MKIVRLSYTVCENDAEILFTCFSKAKAYLKRMLEESKNIYGIKNVMLYNLTSQEDGTFNYRYAAKDTALLEKVLYDYQNQAR